MARRGLRFIMVNVRILVCCESILPSIAVRTYSIGMLFVVGKRVGTCGKISGGNEWNEHDLLPRRRVVRQEKLIFTVRCPAGLLGFFLASELQQSLIGLNFKSGRRSSITGTK